MVVVDQSSLDTRRLTVTKHDSFNEKATLKAADHTSPTFFPYQPLAQGTLW